MGTLSIIFLVLAGIPALLPRRRDAFTAVGAYLALMFAAFVWAHAELGSMSKGEGPAFFGTIIYFGMAQLLLGGSFVARIIAFCMAERVAISARSKIVASLLLAFCAIFALALVGYARGFVGKDLVILAGALLSPLVWIACSLLLMPGNSFKRMPQSSGLD